MGEVLDTGILFPWVLKRVQDDVFSGFWLLTSGRESIPLTPFSKGELLCSIR